MNIANSDISIDKEEKIIDLNEHLSCSRYLYRSKNGFSIRKFKSGDSLVSDVTEYNHVIFLLSGVCKIKYYNNATTIISQNQLGFIPSSYPVCGEALRDTVLIDLSFNDIVGCKKFSLDKLRYYVSNKEYRAPALDMNSFIKSFSSLLYDSLSVGLCCMHFHEIKAKEFWIYLRAFYAQNTLAEFFLPIVGKKLSFVDFVKANFKRINSVDEFASLANMSVRTFTRRFNEEFGMSVRQWINKQICQEMLFDISNGSISIKEFQVRYGFSDSSNFCRFVKMNFGCSPSKLIESCSNVQFPIIEKTAVNENIV